jgi:thiol-disulfide isomerase/thioredoxin
MKPSPLALLAATGLFLGAPSPFASAADAKTDLEQLVNKIRGKLGEGKSSEADLAPEIGEFDAIFEAHKSEKTEDVARILLMKSSVYGELLQDDEKAAALLNRIKTEFPDTALAKRVGDLLAALKGQAESRKIQKILSPGSPFPEFSVTDLEGKPLSLAAMKGKVVLIDFWATWCGPCVAELPYVLKAYEKHRAQGFEIIGVSLDQDKAQLLSFLTREKVTWPQHLDGKEPSASLASKYAVETIPSTFLLDREGKIIEKNLRGEALETAVAKALGDNN